MSLVIVFFGGVFWLATIHYQGLENAKAIQELKSDRNEYIRTLQGIDKRLSRIEGRLGVKSDE